MTGPLPSQCCGGTRRWYHSESWELRWSQTTFFSVSSICYLTDLVRFSQAGFGADFSSLPLGPGAYHRVGKGLADFFSWSRHRDSSQEACSFSGTALIEQLNIRPN